MLENEAFAISDRRASIKLIVKTRRNHGNPGQTEDNVVKSMCIQGVIVSGKGEGGGRGYNTEKGEY